MRTMQLYATGSATGNAVAQVTIPAAARIKRIQYSVVLDSVTDNAQIRVELSKAPVSQIATNGAQDAFLQVGIIGNFVTSGLAQFGANESVPVDVACNAGQIIYCHATVAGTAIYLANFILWY